MVRPHPQSVLWRVKREHISHLKAHLLPGTPGQSSRVPQLGGGWARGPSAPLARRPTNLLEETCSGNEILCGMSSELSQVSCGSLPGHRMWQERKCPPRESPVQSVALPLGRIVSRAWRVAKGGQIAPVHRLHTHEALGAHGQEEGRVCDRQAAIEARPSL